MANLMQGSLAGGELSPQHYASVNLERYQHSLKLCRNFITSPYGGAKNRPGTEFLYEHKDTGKRVRLFPFQFNSDQTFVVEVGELYIRIYQDGVRLELGDHTEYSSSTVYDEGDIVALHSPYFRVFRSLSNGNQNHAPETNPVWWEPSGSGLGTTLELSSPYTESELREIETAQSGDVMTFVHSSHPVMELKRYADDIWAFEEFDYLRGPWQRFNSDPTLTLNANAKLGTVTLTSSKPLWTSYHVGMLIYMDQASRGEPWETEKSITKGQIYRCDGKYYEAMSTGTAGTLRPTAEEGLWHDGGVLWRYRHSGYGIVRIDSITNSRNAVGTVVSRIPDELGQYSAGSALTITAAAEHTDGSIACTATAHGQTVGDSGVAQVVFSGADGGILTGTYDVTVYDANTLLVDYPYDERGNDVPSSIYPIRKAGNMPTSAWRLGAWGPGPGYPSSVAYCQQRQVFGGSLQDPQNIWMTKTGEFNDFGISTPILDSDAVTIVLASGSIDAVRNLKDLGALLIFTAGGEWATSTETISPNSDPGIRQQGENGSSRLPVVGTGKTAIFLQEKGSEIRDIGYEFESQSFTGEDLKTFASHLLEGHTIVEWAWQASNKTLWMIRDDGIMLGMTYFREQNVVAWHRHDTLGEFVSLCVVTEDDEDALYVSTIRTLAGVEKRCFERFRSRDYGDMVNAWFVDCGFEFGEGEQTVELTFTDGTTWGPADTLTVEASEADTFSTEDTGSEIVFEFEGEQYRIRVISFVDGTHVTGIPNKIIPEELRDAGFTPVITSFSADPTTVTFGGSTDITAVFSHGFGVFKNSGTDYSIESGVPLTIYPTEGALELTVYGSLTSVSSAGTITVLTTGGGVEEFLASNADQILTDSTVDWLGPDDNTTSTGPGVPSTSYTNTVPALRANRVALEAAKWATTKISWKHLLKYQSTSYAGKNGGVYTTTYLPEDAVLPSTRIRIGAGNYYDITGVELTEDSVLTASHITSNTWPYGPPDPAYATWLAADVQLHSVMILILDPVDTAPEDISTILSPGDTITFVEV